MEGGREGGRLVVVQYKTRTGIFLVESGRTAVDKRKWRMLQIDKRCFYEVTMDRNGRSRVNER